MADVNTVVVISDRQDLVNQITQKLVLLRGLDKIKSCSIDEAYNLLKIANPNVIIIHCNNNDNSAINLIKSIKKAEILNNIPILMVNENCSRETIIEAFDLGISDIIFTPLIDYELLIRVIWSLKKNELNLNIESRKKFLCKLGVIESETGVYTQKYCDEFIKNELEQTKKYSAQACILLVSPDKKYPNNKNTKEFIDIIKDSIRLNDSIITKDENEYYIYLQKTKLNGAYSVFERINTQLGIDSGINAGVLEVEGQSFEDIKEALEEALKKANENTNSLIVASDFEEEPIEEEPIIKNIEFTNNSEIIKESIALEDEESYIPEEIKSAAYDRTSTRIFNQAFQRKLKVVIEPVFRKYENILRVKRQDFAINVYTGNNSLFCISSNNVTMSLSFEYDGLECVVIKITIVDNGQKRLFETETIDFTILDYRKVSLMLGELIDKFIVILKKK